MNPVVRPKWRILPTSLLALGVLVALATALLGILAYSSRHSTYSLWIYMPEAYEIKPGTTVTIEGVRVGRVEDVRLVNRTVAALQNPHRTVAVKLRISRSDATFIRSDSTARLKAEGLLGDQYVDISRGLIGQPLGEAGELTFQPPPPLDLRKIVSSFISSKPKESSNSKSGNH